MSKDVNVEIEKSIDEIANNVVKQLRKIRQIPIKFGLLDHPNIDEALNQRLNQLISVKMQAAGLIIDGLNLVKEVESASEDVESDVERPS